MRILVITQKVSKNDGYFGFFHSWLLEFAKKCERVTVIALERHAYELPGNVEVLSLGKEEGSSRLTRFTRLIRYAYARRHEYDVVFCHMSPLYVIVGAPVWILFQKPVALWYVHRNADLKLWFAEKLARIIFTASPESFRMKSGKVRYMRQAVSVEQFARPESAKRIREKILRLVSVGRITAIKNLDAIISAVGKVRERGVDCELTLIGAPVTESDHEYSMQLRAEVAERKLEGAVSFIGSVPYKDIAVRYWAADATVNACPTGGMDKTVLESFAAETPVFFTNEAFAPLLAGHEDVFRFPERDADALAELLVAYAGRTDRAWIAHELAERVRHDYSLEALIENIIAALGSITQP